MSIRSDAYQLCKSIWDSPSREDAKKAIEGINSNERRASLGLVARQYINAQALGYLVVDRDKSRIEQQYPPLRWSDSLDSKERQLLAAVHREISELNRLCVAPLTDKMPECTTAVDPYSQFKHQLPEDVVDIGLLTPESMDTMAKSFHGHPAFSVALQSPREIIKTIPRDGLLKGVQALEHALTKTGPLSGPSKLATRVFSLAKDSPEGVMFRYTSALMCIRASLYILDELVYQAILTNKLPVLNENNVIEVGPLKGHIGGIGLSIFCQQDEGAERIGIGLALVKCPFLPPRYPHDLCYVEFIQVQLSNDFGDVTEVHLRGIDENLNRFPALLERP